MLKNILVFAGIFSLSVWSNSAVIGPQTTSGGKAVNLGGLAWLELTHTYGVSRAAVESGHGGLLAGGWRYATRSETENLFDSLWGGTDEGYHASNHDGSSWFMTTLGAGLPDRYTNIYFGEDGSCDALNTVSCAGFMGISADGTRGYARDETGLSVGLTPATNANDTVSKSSVLNEPSSLLVRVVPIPAAAWLFLSAVFGLGILKRL